MLTLSSSSAGAGCAVPSSLPVTVIGTLLRGHRSFVVHRTNPGAGRGSRAPAGSIRQILSLSDAHITGHKPLSREATAKPLARAPTCSVPGCDERTLDAIVTKFAGHRVDV